MIKKISTFDDWIDLFAQWRNDIGFDSKLMGDYEFETKFAEIDSPEIEFGDFAGQRKWETVLQISNQQIRDALLTLIVYQGDTEFASVEQQRHLVHTAPSEEDLRSILRVMTEEMRHGYQMSYLLVNYFGDSGKIEARKLLERRAFKRNRLLGSFNEEVNHWLDFFVYTEFIDRDGKFQLQMLSRCGFAPLGRSTKAMLKEESYHLGTGHTGLRRILMAGKIPVEIIQKYFNKWIPTAYDLFGTDHSSSAHWAYVSGLKARYNEGETKEPADKNHLNEAARALFHKEISWLVDNLNKLIPEDKPKLYVPDMKFNRKIGNYAGKTYNVKGEPLNETDYVPYLQKVLPSPEDERNLQEIFKEEDWITPIDKK
jgi:benzoyl-CoA 2,3-dioxygenase component B